MAETKDNLQEIRNTILQDPQALLNDREVMQALVAAGDSEKGANVIDLKSVALRRMENELEKMEGKANNIISAAYDNISTTHVVHRAILEALEPNTFDDFLDFLAGYWTDSLRVDVARVCLEAPAVGPKNIAGLQKEFGNSIVFLQEGEVDYYITLGKEVEPNAIHLREVRQGVKKIHGGKAQNIRSEALLRLNLGKGNRPGLLVLASNSADHFAPNMATDLLVFYGTVFEKIMQRWLNNG